MSRRIPKEIKEESFGEQYIFPSSPIFGASLEEDWQAAEKRVAEL